MAERAQELIFLAAGPTGVVRASCAPHDAWSVSSHPFTGRVTCLATGAKGSTVVYAGTDGGGVARSVDAGLTWQAAGLEGRKLRSLTVSPHASTTVYAGTKPAALFVTHDGGANWRELTGFQAARRWYWLSPAEPGDLRPYPQSIGVSPTDPSVLVVGVEAGSVVLSLDGGDTWSGHLRGADRDCHTLKFHDTDGDWIYLAGGGGAAVSRDAGKTWRHSDLRPHGRCGWACAADSARPEVWYVSAAPLMLGPRFWRMPLAHFPGEAHASIHRSSGGGAWEKLAGGLPQPIDHMIYALVTDPYVPGHVYAGQADGVVWHSSDHGDRWAPLPFDLGSGLRTFAVVTPSPYR